MENAICIFLFKNKNLTKSLLRINAQIDLGAFMIGSHCWWIM